MARIGVMTFLHNDNYGSTLQAWALQKILLRMGFEAEHMDYRPSKKEKILNLVRSGNSPKLVLESLRKKSVRAGRPGAREKAESFGRFYQRQMKLSPPLKDHSALKKQAGQYDILLCGSDQIWSPVWLNPAYFLDFAAKGQRKVSYAASLGVARLEHPRKARKIRRLTQGFHAVSVREDEGAALMEKITGTRPLVNPDPVLLVGRDEWLALAQRPQTDEKYLLCYFIGNDESYWTRVKKLAVAKGLAIRVLPVTEASYQAGLPLADGASPQEWLGWISSAACLCTDSFHGAAFATLMHTELHIFRRYREDDPESKNSRIDQLTRMLYGGNQTADADWQQVDARLEVVRREALQWLRSALT
ncbi:MAG: polysaccharide pyruvyl transferase family protein [Clostridia bacterium]|nr:polysaccharide pyruvyl transferase family protein [Clostridia bacterium]